MGQDQPPPMRLRRKDSLVKVGLSTKKSSKELTLFERDPRLIQLILFEPELFSGQVDAEVKKVQRLIQLMPYHILEAEIVDGLNQRFSKAYSVAVPTDKSPASQNSLNVPAENLNNNRSLTKDLSTKNLINQSINSILSKETKSKYTPRQTVVEQKYPIQRTGSILEQQKLEYFYELQTQQRFIELIKKFQHWYYIEKQLNSGLIEQKTDKKITVRKKIIPHYESKLDRRLYSKLYLIYYLKILKQNFASKDKARNALILQFHNSIGKMICEMVQHDHFTDKKLMQLAYKIVYLEKTGSKNDLQTILGDIRQEFWPFYLTKQHNLTLKSEQYNRIRQISRCYLDELYLRSLKQAQDPDIIVDTNEGFGILKNFPILRVRQEKHR